MKKMLFFAAIALSALGSCTSDEFVGENNPDITQNTELNAIMFGSGVRTITRTDHAGADAAGLLNNKFIVGGFKGATGTSTVFDETGAITTAGVPSTGMVFDNYQVGWTTNTAGTTQSNTSDWEYVGLPFLAPSSLVNDQSVVQSIKYWDYAADQYDFIAYSTGDATVTTKITSGESADPNDAEAVARAIAHNQVLVTPIDAEHASTTAYKLSGKDTELQKCYIADMVTAYKTGATMNPAQPKFQDEIQFKFRALASKVRVALYETVPGYSVKDVKFYIDATKNLNSTTDGDKVANATLFTTGGEGTENAMNYFYTSGTYTVYFPTIGTANISNSDYNKAHVSFAASSQATTKDFSTLNYTEKEKLEKTGTQFLGRSAATASFAGVVADNYYQIAMPNEKGTVLELRIDYTLESIDGSGEEIHVYGATAFVPAIYAAWKSNYAYTYIFKITDNTNGWTNTANAASNTVDPAGLYPITFDAVVMETQDYTQSTITTVSTPSITTYQKGHVYTDDEYSAAKGAIYVQVMDNDANPAALKTDLNTNGKLYEVAATNTKDKDGVVSEAEIMDALNIVSLDETPVPMNGWTLTDGPTVTYPTAIDGADGNTITVTQNTAAKFTPAANKVYAYVYTVSTGTPAFVGIAVTCSEKPTDWGMEGVEYFSDKACTTKANTDADFTPGIYYQKRYKDNKNVYAVKLIRTKA